MDSHNLKYGRNIEDRILYLLNDLSDKEKSSRVTSFINLYKVSTAGSFDVNEHAKFFNDINNYSLKEIDKVFFDKYATHIVNTPQQLGLDNFL